MKILISEAQLDKLVKKIKDGERFIKCDACNKLFTQTIHKGKKSLPICPWCGRHNTQFNENQEVDERSRSFAFTRKKRLFSKPEMMANPARYKKHEKDIKEIDTYKFAENPRIRANGKEEYIRVKEEYPIIKQVNGFDYHYDVYDDNDGLPSVKLFVLDPENKTQAAVADFDMRSFEHFFVTLPYVSKEYRNKGIAMEMYKIILTFGNLVSGKAQSEQAVGLWKKMYRELPNKMVFVDNDGKEHEIVGKDNSLIVKDSGEDVHQIKGGYLKLYKK